MSGILPVFETARLRLRGLQEGDEEFLVKLDTDQLVMRYVHDGAFGRTAAEQWALMQVDMHVKPNPRKRTGKWMVELRDPVTRIGWVEVGKNCVRSEDFRSVGYEFAPAFWGRGYATEAVISVVGYLFDQLEERAVVAYARPENRRSVRVLQKTGFHFRGERIQDGGHQLCDVYEISLSEWNEMREIRAVGIPPRESNS